MLRRRGRGDDEVHHEVREEHANGDVLPARAQLFRRRAFALMEIPPHRAFLFDFLCGLPEEEIRRDRRVGTIVVRPLPRVSCRV